MNAQEDEDDAKGDEVLARRSRSKVIRNSFKVVFLEMRTMSQSHLGSQPMPQTSIAAPAREA